MLRGLYAPTDFESHSAKPELAAEEKLRIISSSPVLVRPCLIRGKVYEDMFSVTLPFTDGGEFDNGLADHPEAVVADIISVGDAELYGHGIGSRLLRAAIRHAVEHKERITEFHAGWARLGLINTAVRVLGEENVGVDCGGKRYGWGSDKPLDAVFDDHPHRPNRPYMVNGIAAYIDRDLAMTWDAPVRTPPQ